MDYNKKFTLHALADDLEKKVISSVELNKSLTWTGFDGPYILASSDESGFRPILPPSDYLQTINYTKILTSNFYDNFSSFDFQHLIRDILKRYFEDIKIDEKQATSTQPGDGNN